jgi:hypothetical protein
MIPGADIKNESGRQVSMLKCGKQEMLYFNRSIFSQVKLLVAECALSHSTTRLLQDCISHTLVPQFWNNIMGDRVTSNRRAAVATSLTPVPSV